MNDKSGAQKYMEAEKAIIQKNFKILELKDEIVKLRSENEGKQNEIVALRKTVLACEDENSALKARWDIIWKRIKGRRDFFIWHSDKLSQPDKVIGTLKPDSKKQEAGT